MFGSSSQRLREDRWVEVSVSGCQEVEMLQDDILGTTAVAQVVTDQRGDVEPLLLQGLALSVSPPPVNAAGAHRKGKGVDFDASSKQSVQRGRPNHSAVVGQATLQSSSRSLGMVTREYLQRAPVFYE
ncbi:hypothetical protein ACOSQ3_019263 [Xanthoceras sorbifolium]